MCRAFRLFLLLCLSIVSAPAAGDPPRTPRPQVVLISFDGAHDLAQWQRSRTLAARTGARFTYFLSCVFLLSRDTRDKYRGPRRSAGRSNVGFAETAQDVLGRLRQIWLARSEGHEIANHGCGHFDGAAWTAAEWRSELDAFDTVLREAYAINGLPGEPTGWRRFAETEVVGFRAPYLSTGGGLYAALADAGLAYDASGVSRGPVAPGGQPVARFALPRIPEGPRGRLVIAMDYNLFVRHSGGFEKADTDGAFETRTYEAFMAAFDAQYRGGRIPLQVGFHFTLMNGGAYWRALERFAAEVCVRPDVDCVSYGDFLDTRGNAAGDG